MTFQVKVTKDMIATVLINYLRKILFELTPVLIQCISVLDNVHQKRNRQRYTERRYV